MKKKLKAKIVTPIESYELCQLYRQIQDFTGSLNKLKDASAIKKDRLRPAPPHLLDVLF